MAAVVVPPTPFLVSIASLGVTLAGFSGLVSAFRRGIAWKPIDAYRLRQIPEMGLATAVVALATLPLADTAGAGIALRIASGGALVFTIGHGVILIWRSVGRRIKQSRVALAWAAGIDLLVLATALVSIGLGTTAAYEWLLVVLVGRPMVAFVLVLSDVSEERSDG